MRTIKSRATTVRPNGSSQSPDLLESFIGDAATRQKASKARSYAESYRKKSTPKAQREKVLAEVERRISEQDWSSPTPALLVGLYWSCHEKVYGIPPLELDTAKAWARATMQAKRMVKVYFDDDVHQALIFMRWLWVREQGREQYRRQTNSPSTFRITWYVQFCRAEAISDWRADQMRSRARFRT